MARDFYSSLYKFTRGRINLVRTAIKISNVLPYYVSIVLLLDQDVLL